MALKRPPPPPGGELRPCLISGNGREKKSGRGKRGKEGEDGGRIGERMGKGGGTWEIWLRLGENLVGARVEGIVGREDEGAANWIGDLRIGIEVGIASLGMGGGRAGEVGTLGSILRASKANLGVGVKRSCAGKEVSGEKLGVGREGVVL